MAENAAARLIGHRDAAELLRTLLGTWGHHVRVEQDGISGMKAALAQAPQVGVVDIGLPGIDGYQVAENLRARAHTRDVYLVPRDGVLPTPGTAGRRIARAQWPQASTTSS